MSGFPSVTLLAISLLLFSSDDQTRCIDTTRIAETIADMSPIILNESGSNIAGIMKISKTNSTTAILYNELFIDIPHKYPTLCKN